MSTDKTFYFVRHAQSIGNAARTFQGSVGCLTEHGRAQARAVAQYLLEITSHSCGEHRRTSSWVESIIASPHERTRETALIIGSALNRPIVFSDHFIERKHPSLLIGTSAESDDARLSRQHLEQKFAGTERVSDEEGFPELHVRAQLALRELLTIQGEDIVVVTHGAFLSFLVATMIHGENLTPAMVDGFQTRFDNASVSIFEHRRRRTWMTAETCGWIIKSLNNTALLA